MLSARRILKELKRLEITHVLTVPDNASKALLELLCAEPRIQVIPVTREGEAFAIAAGLWVGGKTPVVIVQNTGLLESGDALRGTVMRMRVPLLCLITYRGYQHLDSGQPNLKLRTLSGELLSQPDLDSVAFLTEPTLNAWGIPFDYLNGEQDIGRVRETFRKAQDLQQPVALLITRETR